MAGSRDDGSFAEDRAHHPNRKVGRPEHVHQGEHYAHALFAREDDGSRKLIALGHQDADRDTFKRMLSVPRSPSGKYEYSFDETAETPARFAKKRKGN